MKYLLFTGIFAVACASSVFASNLNKVKLAKEKTLLLNGEYFNKDTCVSEVVKVNKTYNSLIANYEILKDFPCNTILKAEILRSNSKCSSYKKLKDYIVTLCNNKDKYFQYLPDTLIELNQQGKCVPKGDVKTSGHEYFKFYDLLSKKELKNACFKLISTYETQNEILYTAELDFVSNINK